MLMCDGCGKAYHLRCLRPPLTTVPTEETWLCGSCQRSGVSLSPTPLLMPMKPKVFITRKSGGNIKAARSLTNQYVKRLSPSGSKTRWQYGRIEFLGLNVGPKCFTVKWQPGGETIQYERGDLTTMLLPEGTSPPKNLVLQVEEDDGLQDGYNTC